MKKLTCPRFCEEICMRIPVFQFLATTSAILVNLYLGFYKRIFHKIRV